MVADGMAVAYEHQLIYLHIRVIREIRGLKTLQALRF
jgi:hypothetical protein